jgi:hypothetical protein
MDWTIGLIILVVLIGAVALIIKTRPPGPGA